MKNLSSSNLINKTTKASLGWLLLASLFVTSSVWAAKPIARFHYLNSQEQHVQVRSLSDTDEPGCHSLTFSRNIIRFGQRGFEYCTVYSKANCAAGSEMPAMWGGKRYRVADIDVKKPQIKLLRGSKWSLHQEKNLKFKSWYCHPESPSN